MWRFKHSFWTVLHDVLAHPIAGVLWAINAPVTNRAGYWLHDITLPMAWQLDENYRRVRSNDNE